MSLLVLLSGCGGCGDPNACTTDLDCVLGKRCGADGLCVALDRNGTPSGTDGGSRDGGFVDGGTYCVDPPVAYDPSQGVRCGDPTPTCMNGCKYFDGGVDEAGVQLDGGETDFAFRYDCSLNCAFVDTTPGPIVAGMEVPFKCMSCNLTNYVHCIYNDGPEGAAVVDAYLCCSTYQCPDMTADCIASMCAEQEAAVNAHPAALGCLDFPSYSNCF